MTLALLCLNFLFLDIEFLKFDDAQKIYEQTFVKLHETNNIVGDIKICPVTLGETVFIEHQYSGGIGCEVQDFFIFPKNFDEKMELQPALRIIFELDFTRFRENEEN